jgi:hypothetical protein
MLMLVFPPKMTTVDCSVTLTFTWHLDWFSSAVVSHLDTKVFLRPILKLWIGRMR